MKKLRKILTAVAATILVFSLLLLAACEVSRDADPLSYTITFVTGEGTAISPITAKEGSYIVLPDNPARDGYDFDGWFDNADCSGEASSIPSVMPGANVTYYAKWKERETSQTEFTVTFNPNNGEDKTASKVIDGGKVAKPADPVAPEGKEFEYWADKDGNEYDFNGTVTADFELTAKYKDVIVTPPETEKYKVIYDANNPDISATLDPSEGEDGEEVTVKDGATLAPEGYRFLGWTDTKDGTVTLVGTKSDGEVEVGSTITLDGADVTLFAQWAKAYVDGAGKSDDVVYIYDAYIGKGMGAAILVRKDAPDKYGFVGVNEQNGITEFTFYFEPEDGGDVVGRTNKNSTYTLKDGTSGSYVWYDHIDGTVGGYLLSTDGYGSVILMVQIGSQLREEAFGLYEYDARYEDYKFRIIDVLTGKLTDEYFYFALTEIEERSCFIIQGEESGSYLLYDNGELYNQRLDLNGYGAARLYEYDPNSDETTLVASGAYSGTDGYYDYRGEWEFASSDANFKFILNTVSDSDGDIPVYIEYNAELDRTFNAESGDGKFVCDGYGGGEYSSGGEKYSGYCTINEQRTLVTFVPYIVDEEGNASAGGTMYFNVDLDAGTYTVNTDGFIVDGTVLTKYAGTSSVIIVPDGITEIADNAFNYVYTDVSVVSVTIPASVQRIGSRAFRNNYTLTRVTFESETPITVDWSAADDPFSWTAGSFVIVVPEGAQQAYRTAWSDCKYAIKGAVEVTVLDEFEIEDGVLVRYNKQPGSAELLDIVIPDEATAVAANVFRGLTFVRSVDLNKVQTIGDGAFEDCANLRSLVFTEVTAIGEAAFLGCTSLGEDGDIVIPKIDAVGANAFQGCESLKSVKLGATLGEIGDLAFRECNVYEDEPPLVIELMGGAIPVMGSKIGVGNIGFRIKVQNIEVAKLCFKNASWNSYCKHLYIESGEEKGLYIDGAQTLELDGRAVFDASAIWLYEIEGDVITFYEYDSETYTVTELSGTYEPGKITLPVNGGNLVFVKSNGEATFTSDDGKYTLVCDPAIFDPESHEGARYETVTFNGASAQMYLNGYNTKRILNFLDADGKRYDFALTIGNGNVFVYEKTAAEAYVRNIAAADGSVINLHFSGSTVYVFGTLEIVVDAETGSKLPAWGDYGATASNPSPNVYVFTRPYRDSVYGITVTVSDDGTSFTYEYTVAAA